MLLIPTAAQVDDGHDHDTPSARAASTGVTRRWLVARSAGLGGALLGGLGPAMAQAGELRPTAPDARGPFYPLTLPADQDADLTLIAGRTGRAQGSLLQVSGRVLTPKGQPMAGAILEVWQANAVGRYAHPGDDQPAPLDPAFQGYGRIRTDAEGRYSFKTIKPGAYGDRTPHIHFDIRGGSSRLVTQMYFEGEARNEADPLLRRRTADARRTLVSRWVPAGAGVEAGTLAAAWDVVLNLS